MGYRVDPRTGVIETDSADDALDLSRAIMSRNGHVAHALSTPSTLAPESHLVQEQKELGENAKNLLKVLLDRPTGVPTKEVAKALGIGNPKGLAGVNAELRKWAVSTFGLNRRPLIKESRRSPEGKQIRHFRLSDSFIKKLKEAGFA